MSNILIVGITGHLGTHFVEAGKKLGLKLSALVRPESLKDEAKAKLVEGLEIIPGNLSDYDSLVNATKGKDVVVSIVGAANFADQVQLIKAAKESGVKRFVPSEFGFAALPTTVFYDQKSAVRQAAIDAGLDWTAIQAGAFQEWFATGLLNLLSPPFPETVEFYGAGDKIVQFNGMTDIATIALLAAQDPRAANRNVVIDFDGSAYTQTDLIALWEQISGVTVKKTPITREDIEKRIADSANDPAQIWTYLGSIIVRNHSFEGTGGPDLREGDVSAKALFPDYKNVTIPQYFEGLVAAKK
eukprot:c9124_g1_i1.p1 GENE.c9124_g1_i1~~c9124_g1_i1.p1  ORF type:complete len:319 (-),score=83.58 c9124_g1_i1:13-912(-)